MKALTIWQPFAGLIIVGAKPLENRKWAPKMAIGTRFAIHAGKDQPQVADWTVDEVTVHARSECWHNGCILGTVEFRGVIKSAQELPEKDRKWFVGPVAWLLEKPEIWKTPFRCKGALSLWEVPEEAYDPARSV